MYPNILINTFASTVFTVEHHDACIQFRRQEMLTATKRSLTDEPRERIFLPSPPMMRSDGDTEGQRVRRNREKTSK